MLINQDVLWFQVSVDDGVGEVEVFQGQDNVGGVEFSQHRGEFTTELLQKLG